MSALPQLAARQPRTISTLQALAKDIVPRVENPSRHSDEQLRQPVDVVEDVGNDEDSAKPLSRRARGKPTEDAPSKTAIGRFKNKAKRLFHRADPGPKKSHDDSEPPAKRPKRAAAQVSAQVYVEPDPDSPIRERRPSPLPVRKCRNTADSATKAMGMVAPHEDGVLRQVASQERTIDQRHRLEPLDSERSGGPDLERPCRTRDTPETRNESPVMDEESFQIVPTRSSLTQERLLSQPHLPIEEQTLKSVDASAVNRLPQPRHRGRPKKAGNLTMLTQESRQDATVDAQSKNPRKGRGRPRKELQVAELPFSSLRASQTNARAHQAAAIAVPVEVARGTMPDECGDRSGPLDQQSFSAIRPAPASLEIAEQSRTDRRGTKPKPAPGKTHRSAQLNARPVPTRLKDPTDEELLADTDDETERPAPVSEPQGTGRAYCPTKPVSSLSAESIEQDISESSEGGASSPAVRPSLKLGLRPTVVKPAKVGPQKPAQPRLQALEEPKKGKEARTSSQMPANGKTLRPPALKKTDARKALGVRQSNTVRFAPQARGNLQKPARKRTALPSHLFGDDNDTSELGENDYLDHFPEPKIPDSLIPEGGGRLRFRM